LLPFSFTPAFTCAQALPFASHTTKEAGNATRPGFMPVTADCQGGSNCGLGASAAQATAAKPNSAQKPTLFIRSRMLARISSTARLRRANCRGPCLPY
jgi:hypothetical protein